MGGHQRRLPEDGPGLGLLKSDLADRRRLEKLDQTSGLGKAKVWWWE